MANKIFVGSLSWNVDNDMLSQEFSRFGEVRVANVVTDRETGRSRGFGFVTFEDQSSVDEAITGMDGREIDGRQVRVSEATERPPQRN